jgi:7,8-dihydroneopterin aldolase/epimerase/oxygenase
MRDATPAPSEEDQVAIAELELHARIGVSDEERAQPQRLTISITMWPRRAFGELRDDIRNAVDYAAVCHDVKELVRAREDKLIETLASAAAEHLLRCYPLKRVRIELRKFVLPDAQHAAVILVRECGPGA